MTNREYLLCQKINAGEIQDWRALPAEEQGLVRAMAARKWVWLDQAGTATLEPEGQLLLLLHAEELDRLKKEAQQRSDEEAKQKREKAADIRRSWVQFWLGLLLGWILGGFTFDEAVRFVLMVIEKFVTIFQ